MSEKSTSTSGLTEARKQEIITRLQERGVSKACPMCGKGQWALLDGYFNQPLQTQLDGLILGKSVPSVIVICNHCGYLSQHALGTLGLLKIVNAASGEQV